MHLNLLFSSVSEFVILISLSMICSCLFQFYNYLLTTCNSDSIDSTNLNLIQAILLLLSAISESDRTTAPSIFSIIPILICFVGIHCTVLLIPCTCFKLSPFLTCKLSFQKRKPITNLDISFSKPRHGWTIVNLTNAFIWYAYLIHVFFALCFWGPNSFEFQFN